MNILQQYDQIARTPEFQNASDQERENVRLNLFYSELAPKLNQSQMEDARREYDRFTAPEGDPSAGMLEDYGRTFAGGLATPVADVAQAFTLGKPNAVSSTIREGVEGVLSGRSPSAIEAERNTGIEYNEQTGRYQLKPESGLYGATLMLTGGAASMVPSIAMGGGAGKLVGMAGRAMGGGMKAAETAVKARNYTRAKDAVQRFVAQKNRDMHIGFAASGAAMIGGGTGAQAYETVMNTDENTLMRSPVYQQLLNETGDPGQARLRLAESAAREGTLKGGLLGAATQGLSGPLQARMLTGGGAVTRTGNIAQGAGVEAAQEFIESGGQQYLSGMAQGSVGLEQSNLAEHSLAAGLTGQPLAA